MEPQVVYGPVAPSPGTGIIYQVTLASGMIATNPSAFPDGATEPSYVSALVTESGRVLVNAKVSGGPESNRQP